MPIQAAKLDQARCWDNVVDFRWHRTTKSPNWHILAEKDRIDTFNQPFVAEGWCIVREPVSGDDSNCKSSDDLSIVEEAIKSAVVSIVPSMEAASSTCDDDDDEI